MQRLITLFVLIVMIAIFATTAMAKHAIKHSHRFTVAATINRALLRTPMRGLGFQLESAGHRWNVNPALVAAIAGTESSYGAAACGPNYWGWDSCNGQPWDSVSSGIIVVTRSLRRNYLDQGMTTLYSIGYRYCGAPTICNLDRWVSHTGWFMRQLGFDQTVTYP